MVELQKPTGFSGHAHFTIDEIAAMLPGPARLMHEVGTRWWKVYYAARAKNWPLAAYELKELSEAIEICMVTRPKYQQFMEPFLENDIRAVEAALGREDWTAFEAAYHQATRNANDYHKAAGKPLVRWKLPEFPPPDLEMEPESP